MYLYIFLFTFYTFFKIEVGALPTSVCCYLFYFGELSLLKCFSSCFLHYVKTKGLCYMQTRGEGVCSVGKALRIFLHYTDFLLA